MLTVQMNNRLALVKDKADSQKHADLRPCSGFAVLAVALLVFTSCTCKMPFTFCLG